MSVIKNTLAKWMLVTIPEFSGKRRLLKLVSLILKGAVVKTAYGVDMVVDVRDNTNYFSLSGSYGNVIADVIKEFPEDSAFLDIGANAGLFSLVAAKKYTSGVVVSFEPQTAVASSLMNNLKINRVDNVLVLNSAISNNIGWLTYQPKEKHSGTVYLLNSKHHTSEPEKPNTSRAFTLNQEAFSNLLISVFGDRTTVVKVDVEGAELIVIQQLTNIISKLNVVVFIVEISEMNLKRYNCVKQDIYALFNNLGFAGSVDSVEREKEHYDEVFRIRQQD